jgi:AcrR family transcriptional regulator
MKVDRAEEKRAVILDAALEVFGDKGYHAANIADIALKLGMGHGTFYRYFENKLDIFRHVVDAVVLRVAQVVAVDAPEGADDLASYRRQVERIGERLAALFLEEEHAARLLFVEAIGIDPAITERLDSAFELFGDTTEAYLVNGQKRGFLRRDLDTANTARAINAMIFEGVRRASKTGDPKAKKRLVRAWMRAVVALMFEGLGA